MDMIEISESNYQSYLNLDSVAFSFAYDGAMGEPGGIIIIDKSGQIYHANYYFGDNTINRDHIKDIIPVFTDLEFSLLGAESINENWVAVNLGFGTSLLMIKDIYDAFQKKAEEANYQYSHEIYRHWKGIVLSLLDKTQ